VLIVIVAVLARNRLGNRLGRVIVDYVKCFTFLLTVNLAGFVSYITRKLLIL
jgi:hypothetical protein